MADFYEESRARIRDLSSNNPAKRREAAYYLGEAGVDEAITKLATMYRSDEDASVREAAAYALGQFRAVEEALERGEEEQVVSLLRRVVEQGKMGRRLKTPTSRLVRTEIFLFITFLLLAGANLFLPQIRAAVTGQSVEVAAGGETAVPQDDPAATPVPDRDRATLLRDLRSAYGGVNADLTTLQLQFQSVLGGGSLDCAAFFNAPGPFAISAADTQAHPDLAGLAQQLNAAQATMDAARTRYEQACFEDNPLTIETVGGELAPVVEAQQSLAALETALAAIENPATATPTEAPTDPAATPTPQATAAPTVTVVIANPRQHLVPLYGIVDGMTDPRGANGLLLQYWTDASTAGVTDGCEDARPNIPDDYTLPPQDAEASEELRQAVEQINIGLGLVRDGWNLFESACSTGRLSADAGAGLRYAETAEQAFDNAQTLLNTLRSGA